MMTRRAALLGLTSLGVGCAMRVGAPVPSRPERVTRSGPGVWRYESTPWSFSTASYWIEGPEGVVVIDTQFLASEAEAVLDAVAQTSGKPVCAALVLHPNPDRFNGTATFQRRGIDVLSSDAVLAEIPGVHAQRLAAFGDRYAPDFPVRTPAPTSLGAATTVLQPGGLALTAHVLGAGCGAHHVVVQWNDHVFVGDLVAHHAHAWMELGLLDAWRARLTEIAALQPARVHPGRGPSAGPQLLDAQRAYLDDVERRVADAVAALPAGADPKPARAAVVDAIVEAYPQHRFAAFVSVAMPALWARAMRERARWTARTSPVRAACGRGSC